MDARLQELQFLALVDRETEGGRSYTYQRKLPTPKEEHAEVQMVVSLLHEGYLNDYFERLRTMQEGQHYYLAANLETWRNRDVESLVRGGSVGLWFSHKGRVRLSELTQQLRAGRDRDPTGLLLDHRHVAMGVAVSILSASAKTPLSIAFLDMNDLTYINNTYGHQVGDRAILAFFHAVLATFGKIGEAYRNGGDEVVVALPEMTESRVHHLLATFVKHLGKNELDLPIDGARFRLTASCGSVTTTDPNCDAKELLELADKVQYRAKEKSGERDHEKNWKRSVPRVSAFAVGETGEVAVHDPNHPDSIAGAAR